MMFNDDASHPTRCDVSTVERFISLYYETSFVVAQYKCYKKGTADGGTVVKVLCYKSEGHLVRFQMVSLEFFIDIILPIALLALGSTQSLKQMSTMIIFWG
jgi:hypothetical protein